MIIGTAGFTAVLSLAPASSARAVAPGDGPVLVTGASGGVGSMAVALLARPRLRGGRQQRARPTSTTTSAGSGRPRSIGASPRRRRRAGSSARALGRPPWTASAAPRWPRSCAPLRYGGAVAASGLTGGHDLATTVYPFIVRGVALLGVDSVVTPIDASARGVGDRRPTSSPPELLDGMVATEVGLDGSTRRSTTSSPPGSGPDPGAAGVPRLEGPRRRPGARQPAA